MQRVVLASGNLGKLAEIRDVLRDFPIELIAQNDLGVVDADEIGLTFVENALIKARHASMQAELPALADDSGLCVDALDGAPGLISAHYAGVHGDSAGNIRKLIEQLRDVPEAERTASFLCCMVLLRHANDPQPIIVQALWRGSVLLAPQGEQGFGYDPVFFVPEHQCSAAQLTPEIKNRISHRGQALAKLRELWSNI